MEITQELVRELFDYKDGKLYWKKRISKRGKIGNEAGYTNHMAKGDRHIIYLYGKSELRSRLIFIWHYGWLPEIVDHDNRNSLDDVIENLRPASLNQNNQNSTSHRDSKSIYLGVHLNEGRYWRARIRPSTGTVNIGNFPTEQEAALAYNREAVRYFGEFANLNIIQL